MSDTLDFPDFGPEKEGPPGYTESFLMDMGHLIERYCREFDLDYLYIIGCLDLQKRVLLDAMVDAAFATEDEDEDDDESTTEDGLGETPDPEIL